ncbi:hypothetical protein Tco_0175269 [Tanacetum coccineum]
MALTASESPQGLDSEDIVETRKKRRIRVMLVLPLEDKPSDIRGRRNGNNGKSKNKYRGDKDEDKKSPTRRRDPDDHLKIFDIRRPLWKNWRTTRVVPQHSQQQLNRGQEGADGGERQVHPLTNDPKEIQILATEGSNFPKPPPMRTPEEQRVGNGYCEYHRQKGHTTNECVQLRQLIDKLVKEGRLDHLVKNIKEGKDKQRSGGKKDAPRDKADTIYMVQSWQRKTKQKVSQKFSHGSGISFPTLTADNAVVEPLTIEINAAGHDIHRMYIDGGASADILYEHCFQRLRPEVKSQLNPATTSLTGFTGEKIWPMGATDVLPEVMVGNKEALSSTTAWMNFNAPRDAKDSPSDGAELTPYLQHRRTPKEGNTSQDCYAYYQRPDNWKVESPYADTPSISSWTHYKGYSRQIKWTRMTRKKTAFHTSQGGRFLLQKMPFWPKERSATYQRLVPIQAARSSHSLVQNTSRSVRKRGELPVGSRQSRRASRNSSSILAQQLSPRESSTPTMGGVDMYQIRS